MKLIARLLLPIIIFTALVNIVRYTNNAKQITIKEIMQIAQTTLTDDDNSKIKALKDTLEEIDKIHVKVDNWITDKEDNVQPPNIVERIGLYVVSLINTVDNFAFTMTIKTRLLMENAKEWTWNIFLFTFKLLGY